MTILAAIVVAIGIAVIGNRNHQELPLRGLNERVDWQHATIGLLSIDV